MKSSLYANKDRYIINFANAYYAEYKRLKYGIKTCRSTGKLWLDELRYELIDYSGDVDFCSQCGVPDLTDISIQFPSRGGACCNVVQQGKSFVYTQNPAATVWAIIHNMGFVPNVFAEDENGNDIVGVVSVINNNEITLTFNTPVAGKAYLS
jgi:hypothetical protein